MALQASFTALELLANTYNTKKVAPSVANE